MRTGSIYDDSIVGDPKYTYFADGLGSIDRLLDSSEDTQETYAYHPFGTFLTTVEGGSTSNPYHFTSREYNSDIALHYYRARWMDSTAGRFLSKDPVWHVNLYHYVRDNPLNFVDPFGKNTVCAPAHACVEMDCWGEKDAYNRWFTTEDYWECQACNGSQRCCGLGVKSVLGSYCTLYGGISAVYHMILYSYG